MPSWKRDVASGLVVLVPLMITLWVVYWLYTKIADLPLLQQAIPNPGLRVVLTLVIFALMVVATGYLMRTALGSLVESVIDDVMNTLPGLRVVYNASKMAVETALTGTDELQSPVKVTMWGDIRLTGFKTGKKTDDGREIVFMPTAPNITTGFVMEVKPEDLTETDEKVEDALTRVLSAGFGDTKEKKAFDIPVETTVKDSTDD
ncbi:DUF502 domain-containing protein [Halobacteriaceae archaeon GCM10025711]